MKPFAVVLVVLVLVIIGLFAFASPGVFRDDDARAPRADVPTAGSRSSSNVDANSPVKPEVKVFAVVAENLKFTPAEMRVRAGDTVRINLESRGGTHDLKIDPLGVATGLLDAGETDSVEFTAPSVPGTYEYYCSVGNHREMGMRGTLVVEG